MAAASVSPFVRPVGIAASVIAIVQGVVWIALTLCAALIYLTVWKPDLNTSTYGQTLSTAIVSLYLTADYNPTDVFIDPLQLFIWTILYLVVSIMWTSISLYQFFVLMENKHEVIKKTFFAWAICTIVVCICDLVLTSLLASDYNYSVEIINIANVHLGEPSYIILACGVMMTLAARGFVLWIVNLTLTVFIMKLSQDFSNKVTGDGYNNNSNAVNAYGQVNPPGQGFHNPNYNTWEANKPDFTRSDSFVGATSHPAPEHLPKLPPIASTNERLAKIGRQGAKSPPHNVAPPKLPQSYIYPVQPRVPSPDYSPPNSPLQTPLKSALKNRNQNFYGYSNSRY